MAHLELPVALVDHPDPLTSPNRFLIQSRATQRPSLGFLANRRSGMIRLVASFKAPSPLPNLVAIRLRFDHHRWKNRQHGLLNH